MNSRSLVALLLLWALVSTAVLGQEGAEPLELSGAETSLEFNRHILAHLGLQLVFRQTVGSEGEFTRAVFPAAELLSLRVQAPGGSFEGLDGGILRHPGGFEMAWRGGSQSMLGFELAPAGAEAPETALFELRSADGAVPFLLDSPHAQYLAPSSEFVFLNMDLLLSEAFARRLGKPEFAGSVVGSADLRTLLAEPPWRGNVPCVSNVGDELDVDIELTAIFNLVEVYCTSDRVAMAPSVILRNIGPSDVEWYRPIYPDGGSNPAIIGPHPFLVMNLYRLADGVMHQIGRADVKHAFFAANSDCECAGAQILFAGCTDLYQAQTNYNRVNLAPREEVTASTGLWQSSGSHFDGTPVDDERSHHGEGGSHPDGFEHRLTTATEDLLVPGARYFIEAGYVAAGDIDIFNSVGRREVSPQLDGGWTFPFVGAGFTQGPALDAWIDPAAPPAGTAATGLDTGEGHLELVAVTAALSTGAYRYDFGLMNFDFDRRIRSFSVPLPAGIELAGIGFYDGDDDPGNDWQSVVTASEIIWSTPGADPSLGALDWGTMFNFGFDANAAPTDLTATLGVLEAGSPNQLTAASKGPGGTLVPVNRLDVTSIGSGLGQVTSTPAGIGCGSDCEELYAASTAVQLAAAAEPGSALIRWMEGGATLGIADTQDTLLDIDRSLAAVFELCDRQLAAQTVAGAETFEACDTLRAGAGFVVGATGVVTLRAGSRVMLGEGFRVDVGGELVTEFDPSLLP